MTSKAVQKILISVERARDRKLRRRAWRLGFIIRKWSLGEGRGWRIVNRETFEIEAGERFELTTEEVEEFLSARTDRSMP